VWLTLLASTGVLDKAYEQLIATGIVGAICLVLGYALYKLYHSKEEQRQKLDEAYQQLVEKLRVDTHALHKEYHAELKGLTEQLMSLLQENATSEAKHSEVLQQVIGVQSDVERTLDRFLERFAAGGERGLRR